MTRFVPRLSVMPTEQKYSVCGVMPECQPQRQPMPFKTYDNQEAVPADERDVYEEREVDGAKRWYAKVPDVAKLDSALNSERNKASDAEKARRAAEKERDDLKRSAEAKTNNVTDDHLQKLRDDDAIARKPLEEERDRLKTENRKFKLDDKAGKIALDKGIMPKHFAHAMAIALPRLDLSDADNIIVKDAAGNVTTQTVDEFFDKTFRAEADWAYKGTGSSGSGATGSDAQAGQAGAKTAKDYAAEANKERAARPNALTAKTTRTAA